MPNLNRFVDPTLPPKRIALTDGDWIEIKPKLHVGDQKRLENAGLGKPVLINGNVYQPIDWSVYEICRAEIWLLDWSFRTSKDKPMPLTLDAITRLEPDTFKELSEAIRLYVAEQEAAKKAAAPTSASPSSGASTTPASPSTETV